MPKKVPVPANGFNAETLEAFAQNVAKRMAKGKLGPFAMERLACRIMEGTDQRAMAMFAKIVEWNFGVAKQRHEHTGADGGPIQHVLVERLLAARKRVDANDDRS